MRVSPSHLQYGLVLPHSSPHVQELFDRMMALLSPEEYTTHQQRADVLYQRLCVTINKYRDEYPGINHLILQWATKHLVLETDAMFAEDITAFQAQKAQDTLPPDEA